MNFIGDTEMLLETLLLTLMSHVHVAQPAALIDCAGVNTNSSFRYISSSQQEPTELPCSAYCPPNRVTDRSLWFCWSNCKEYFECELRKTPSGTQVLSTWLSAERAPALPVASDESTVTANSFRPNSRRCQQTWFYHPITQRFYSCVDICASLNIFCRRNCPGYHACRSTAARSRTTTMNVN